MDEIFQNMNAQSGINFIASDEIHDYQELHYYYHSKWKNIEWISSIVSILRRKEKIL